MRENRRPLTRWLAGMAVVIGLFAMHGLTATTASAAAHCGGIPTHSSAEHHAEELGAPGPLVTMGVDAAGLDAGHAGALCVAILLMGVVLALMARNGRRPAPLRIDSRHGARPSRGVRAPPDRADLSVWRN